MRAKDNDVYIHMHRGPTVVLYIYTYTCGPSAHTVRRTVLGSKAKRSAKQFLLSLFFGGKLCFSETHRRKEKIKRAGAQGRSFGVLKIKPRDYLETRKNGGGSNERRQGS